MSSSVMSSSVMSSVMSSGMSSSGMSSSVMSSSGMSSGMSSSVLHRYKGFHFHEHLSTEEHIDSLQNLQVLDSDVFLVTFPKSGTIWAQQIIVSIFELGLGLKAGRNNLEQMPWLEFHLHLEHSKRSPPRLYSSHLPPHLLPRVLREGKGKVVHVMRNPKDNMVSYFYFSKAYMDFPSPTSFDQFMEDYLLGNILGASTWFDHIRQWHTSSEQIDVLHLTYEQMIQDLRGAVVKICAFLGQNLSDADIDKVVEKSSFKSMKNDAKANYKFIGDRLKGDFMRKGNIGDWKNVLTAAQSERVDQLIAEKLGDLNIHFTFE